MPGFEPYRGSCYHISEIKSTWRIALNNCPKKSNSSLVALETIDELNFVAEKLLKPRNMTQALIGLAVSKSDTWQWLDGRDFESSLLKEHFYSYRSNSSRCGIVYRPTINSIAIEGRDCIGFEANYVCRYGKSYYSNSLFTINSRLQDGSWFFLIYSFECYDRSYIEIRV